MININIVLLGESGVGKTTLLQRFQTGVFKGVNSFKSTLGADYKVKNLTLEGHEITLRIWDLAGDQKQRNIVGSYYRQGEGVLLVYDVTNAESFHKLSDWLRDLRNKNEKAEILIVGNKNEEPSTRAVTDSEVRDFAREENLEYVEMSAMSGANVEEAFLRLVKKILIAKGILTEEPDESHQGYINELWKIITLRKWYPDEDIIRLEDTPPTSENKRVCC